MDEDRCRLPRYDVSLDSYRAAKILIDRHGDEARAEAGRRLEALLDAGDEAGAATWADIVFAVQELQRGMRPEDRRH